MESIYLFLNTDRTYTAAVYNEAPPFQCAKLTEEKEYPVQIIYNRSDLNGSSVLEDFNCANQKELLESLNWIGECGWTLLEVWDFDKDNSMTPDLKAIFQAAEQARYEKEQIAAAEMLEEGIEANSEASYEEKLEALKRQLFMSGTEAIEDFLGDFLGIDIDYYDKDSIDNLMDQVACQMPEEEFEKYCHKYLKNPVKKVSLNNQIQSAESRASETGASASRRMNVNNNELKPYRILITETLSREVVIYAATQFDAHEFAEELCNDGIIDLSYDDFSERNTECKGIARSTDLKIHDIYYDQNANDNMKASNKTETIDEKILSASARADESVPSTGSKSKNQVFGL